MARTAAPPASRRDYEHVARQQQQRGGAGVADAEEDALREEEEEDAAAVPNHSAHASAANTSTANEILDTIDRRIEERRFGRIGTFGTIGLLISICLGVTAVVLLHQAGVFGPRGGGGGRGPPASYDTSADTSHLPPRDASPDCRAAKTPPSSLTHLVPNEQTPVSRLAFASCFIPSRQSSPDLWRHLRETFRPDLFVWLGDNMYQDTFANMDAKRQSYNEARTDPYYARYGPVAEPKIPTTGTWDDHDFGYDNMGKDYPCLKSSQDEFVTHFNLPPTDVRHPARGDKQRNGVYNSQMFPIPDTSTNNNNDNGGMHVINLDARSHRSPTYAYAGSNQAEAQPYAIPCAGANSTMLGATQWEWLHHEMLQRKSVVKVISSGVQFLPPTNRDRDKSDYCSYDGPGGTFDRANWDVGEGTDDWVGTKYEGWGEMPQERTRLLRLAQRSMNAGMARHVVFLTGDQHWAEIQVKRIPGDDDEGGDKGRGTESGPSRVVYGVTASGIDQHYVEDVGNTNRVRVRSADRNGDGVYTAECNFPFVVDGVAYDDCADVFGTEMPGCATETTTDNVAVEGRWGNCLDAQEELVPRDRQTYGRKNKCTDNYHHTCAARANYGGIVVDWDRGTMDFTVFTPHEEEVVASSVEIDL